MTDTTIRLESATDVVLLEAATLRLVSLRAKHAPEQEFIDCAPEHPAFQIGYYDAKKRYRLLTSHQAAAVKVTHEGGTATAVYTDVGGLALDVTCSVSAAPQDRFVRWKVAINNRGGVCVADVQYPFVVCAYHLGGGWETEKIALPHGYGSGRLLEGNLMHGDSMMSNRLRADAYLPWEFCAREGSCSHYPGMQYAQYMAFYNERAGFYIACNDSEGGVKRFLPLHREPGIRFGISHVGDWPEQGSRELPYEVLTTSFEGDWYDATDIYREWSLSQKWFVPIREKGNTPDWLTDSPVYLTIRPGGILDTGPVTPVEEFLPYEKCIPLLEGVAEKVKAPLSIVLMGWERAGSWVYPDCFPPIGGEESMRNFMKMLHERGWHGGCFNSGTRWCYDQVWSGYDGRDYLDEIGAEAGMSREANGTIWEEDWGRNFRGSFLGCIGTQKMRDTSLSIVEHLVDWGMESLQYLDQNNGSATFPCFADDHEHPPMPGRWMYEKMQQLTSEMQEVAHKKGVHTVIHSAESGLNETCLPMFQETELRVYPDGYGSGTIPIYQYLFHECIVLQGMMGNAPEPYHLAMRNAVNCVLGGIPGGVLTGNGKLLDKDTNNWALWEPYVEDADAAFDMIRTVSALRRGVGKEFLVFGRMQRPATVDGIETMRWEYEGRKNQIDKVFHTAWTSQDKHAVVLANWSPDTQTVVVKDARLGATVEVSISADTVVTQTVANHDGVQVVLPPRCCALVVQG